MGPVGTEAKRRVFGIGTSIVGMFAVVLVLGRIATSPPPHPEHPITPTLVSPALPIAAEAGVFATTPSELAVAPATEASRPGRPRTLAAYRSLRAYPGAPPRIPHVLTDDEFRLSTCSTCHEPGGYVTRFGAYTPVTPHPEFSNCLQCHLPEQTSEDFRGIDWLTSDWPETGQAALDGSPPWIPHDLQLRENCLTCHGGPGAVSEIRTTHPERMNCRQCHVPASEEATGAEWVRPGGSN
jgi:cytochrome c-type protein NapB